MSVTQFESTHAGEYSAPLAERLVLREEERFARLRLARSRNVGPRTYLHLIRRFGTGLRALEALPELATRGGSASYELRPEAAVAQEMDAAERIGARLAILGEDAYPRQLATIDTPPPVLWILGDGEAFAQPSIGIVGARNASAMGLRTARQIARGLARAGRIVVSGLARGIDAAAHEAALENGTIAVLAGGLDRVYPPENEGLAARIAEGPGALVTECPMGVEPTARHFPKRNRLVAGLSAGVLLIEAASRSGSLITARYALEQGREVMACPGAPEDPRAAGCNAMIRDGAALVRSAQDVLDALAMPAQLGFAEGGAEFHFDAFDDADDYEAMDDFDPDGRDTDIALAEQVVRLIGTAPIEIDEVARACGTRPSELSLVLLELELAGRIEQLPGGRVVQSA
ncbi:MAG: DNA-processing protein DprA [Pseudomonadota bacterium]